MSEMQVTKRTFHAKGNFQFQVIPQMSRNNSSGWWKKRGNWVAQFVLCFVWARHNRNKIYVCSLITLIKMPHQWHQSGTMSLESPHSVTDNAINLPWKDQTCSGGLVNFWQAQNLTQGAREHVYTVVPAEFKSVFPRWFLQIIPLFVFFALGRKNNFLDFCLNCLGFRSKPIWITSVFLVDRVFLSRIELCELLCFSDWNSTSIL